MSNLLMSFTVFHAIAAVAIFGLMIVGVLGTVQGKRHS